MYRVKAVGVALLAAGLWACGNNEITGNSGGAAQAVTATSTATSPPTPTVTDTPTATRVPPTATPTATASPSATLTMAATASPTVTSSATATSTPAVATLRFSLDALAAGNPFPSDRLLDATGHPQVPVSYFDPGLPPLPAFAQAHNYIANITTQLSALSGFGTFAPIRIQFDKPVAVGSGENPPGLVLLEYDDLAAPPPRITASFYAPDLSIEIQPRVPLKPKTTYALLITTALTDVDGNAVRPAPEFSALLAGSGLSVEQAAWRARLQPLLDFADHTLGIRGESVVLADLFTTTATTDDLITIQQRLVSGDLVPGPPVFENSPIHGLTTGIFAEGTPQYQDLLGAATTDNVAEVAIGSFDSYDFRFRPNGGFDPSLLAQGSVPPVNHLDFYMTVPKAPPPANGYPIAIFGHGLGGSGRDVTAVPLQVGDAPVMGIAISDLQHGRRGDPLKLFVLTNISTTREYFRQTVADYMQLVRMVKNAQAAGIAPFDKVDPDHILYTGVSLGGIMGTMFMAVEPDVRVGVLSVPGGGLPNIVASHDIGQLLQPLIAFQGGVPQDSPFFPLFLHHFMQVTQWTLESADPIDYAPYIIDPERRLPGVPVKRVLVHEGIIDNTIPNRTTDDLALAMRLPDLNLSHGCMDQDGCSGIWRYVMAEYGQDELSGHGVTFNVPQARMQAGQFLASLGTLVPDEHP
jgi:Big-like domain-containing protein